jgi:hypothetical protein
MPAAVSGQPANREAPMPLCPSGHQSQTSDYCDTCGAVMGGAPITHASQLAGGSIPDGALAQTVLSGIASSGGESGGSCPVCGADRDGRFCEECGYDFELAELVSPPSAAPDPAVSAPPPSMNGVAAEQQPTVLLPETPLPPPPPATAVPEFEAEAPPEAPSALGAAAAGAGMGAPAGDPTKTYLPPEFGVEEEPASGSGFVPETGAAEAEPASAPVGEPVEGGADLGARPQPGPPLAVLAAADLEYYTAQVSRGDILESDYPFPKYPQELRFTLDGDKARIGRSSASRGIAVEVDLASPPVDPAVSHLHAQFLRTADGSWAVVDLNSANGTRINGAADPIPAETEVPVAAGDRIHLGVWTTLTITES